MELQTPQAPFGWRHTVLGLPLQTRLLVVWTATSHSRAIGQLARGLGYGPSTNPSGLHCHNSVHCHGTWAPNGILRKRFNPERFGYDKLRFGLDMNC